MARQTSAPKYLNLLRIQMPVGAVLSIAHRISGVLLFLALPFLAYLFALSLQGPGGYASALEWLAHPLARLTALLLVWSIAHHLLAGIRHLLLDIHLGVNKTAARASAWVVNIAALLLTLAYLLGAGL